MHYFDTTIKLILNEAGFTPQAGDFTSIAASTVKSTADSVINNIISSLKSQNYEQDLVNMLKIKISNLSSFLQDPQRDNKIKIINKILNDRLNLPASNFKIRGSLKEEDLKKMLEDGVPQDRIDRLRILTAPLDRDELAYLNFAKIEKEQIKQIIRVFDNRGVEKQQADKQTQDIIKVLNKLSGSIKQQNQTKTNNSSQTQISDKNTPPVSPINYSQNYMHARENKEY